MLPEIHLHSCHLFLALSDMLSHQQVQLQSQWSQDQEEDMAGFSLKRN